MKNSRKSVRVLEGISVFLGAIIFSVALGALSAAFFSWAFTGAINFTFNTHLGVFRLFWLVWIVSIYLNLTITGCVKSALKRR